MKKGSAYDLFLTRTLAHAEVVRGSEGTSVFAEQRLEVATGIRQPVADFVADHLGTRLLEPRFMEIQQAVGTARARNEAAIRFLHAAVEELKANGFIAGASTDPVGATRRSPHPPSDIGAAELEPTGEQPRVATRAAPTFAQVRPHS